MKSIAFVVPALLALAACNNGTQGADITTEVHLGPVTLDWGALLLIGVLTVLRYERGLATQLEDFAD